jgi:hypothetical protein
MLFPVHLSWGLLTITVGVILASIIGLTMLSPYLGNLRQAIGRMFRGAKYSKILSYVPKKNLMLAMDYLISKYYKENPMFSAANLSQVALMIVAAYLPDRRLSAEELREITQFLLDSKFKVTEMLQTDVLDIPNDEKNLVDTLVDLAPSLTGKQPSSMPLRMVKTIINSTLRKKK